MRRASDFLYVRLYKTLKDQILTGLIKPGDYLAPENELCRHYGLSRNSVRKALDELHKEGLVVKKVGLGTFVPADVAIGDADRKKLRIVAPFPAYFVDNGLPLLCDAFRRKYPHVDIHVLSLPNDTYVESLLQSGRLGFTPDIVLLGEGQLSQMDDRSAFADLTPAVGESVRGLYPPLRRPLGSGPAVRAVPVTFSPLCLAYNPELFAAAGVPAPGSDWRADDFAAAAERLTSVSAGRIDRFGFSLHPSLSRWLVFALQNGMKPDGPDNRRAIAQALERLQDWLHRKRIATVYTDSKNLTNPFIYGKAAMTLTTLFEMSTWQERGIDFAPMIAPLPFGETKATLMQANLLMVPSDCADPKLSLAFVGMALEDGMQRLLSGRTPFLSVLDTVNAGVHSPDYLRALNIGDGLIDNNFFLHELIDEQIDQSDLMVDMSLFWLGLEDARAIAERF
ncbi:extracellular solute-binding protein [Paenibacillus sp. GYB003]|uniref:extracellular solute-binding protein n=1 Tax=Paenibacillus sp. GYB003 TaxID=2994392 RepID=UPI002F96B797